METTPKPSSSIRKRGVYTNLTNSPWCYDEPEGVFPDGLYTCVEHGPSRESAWPLIDLFKLKLDGSGDMQRLTHFTDVKGYKASQGVVSDDGRHLCFQIGKAGEEAGVGFGIYLMDLEAAKDHLGAISKLPRMRKAFTICLFLYLMVLASCTRTVPNC